MPPNPRNPCAGAPKRLFHELPHESLQDFARPDRSAGSKTREFPGQQLVFTTNVCLERLAPYEADDAILLGRWFRLTASAQPPPVQGKVAWSCDPPRVSRDQMVPLVHTSPPTVETSLIGSAWLPDHLMSVPCPASGGLQLLNASRSLNCWSPMTWRHAPAENETAWLLGVTLTSNENHINNFHHWNRDLLFFNRFLTKKSAEQKCSGAVAV